MCRYCESKEKIKYQENRYADMYITNMGTQKLLEVNIHICPKFQKCTTKDMNISVVYPIDFCPNCGADLTSTDEQAKPIDNSQRYFVC